MKVDSNVLEQVASAVSQLTLTGCLTSFSNGTAIAEMFIISIKEPLCKLVLLSDAL